MFTSVGNTLSEEFAFIRLACCSIDGLPNCRNQENGGQIGTSTKLLSKTTRKESEVNVKRLSFFLAFLKYVGFFWLSLSPWTTHQIKELCFLCGVFVLFSSDHFLTWSYVAYEFPVGRRMFLFAKGRAITTHAVPCQFRAQRRQSGTFH